jgi:hypothetical protein
MAPKKTAPAPEPIPEPKSREPYLSVLRSLDAAMEGTGGAPLTAEQICTMTVDELFELLGPNDIRFAISEA